VGRVDNLQNLFSVMDDLKGEYDALAIATVIDVPFNYHMDYFRSGGEMINPWGGVEAMLTHAISSLYDIPAAHAPMDATSEIADIDPGIVDPRIAAEATSVTYFQCALKGLQRSPRIMPNGRKAPIPGVISVENVSCVVMPDHCLGLPTFAALEQGIPVIAVRENRNILNNDLTALPWKPGQLHIVENYWEAAGVISALKAGIDPSSARRPLAETRWETKSPN
jgi:hypothetical protein